MGGTCAGFWDDGHWDDEEESSGVRLARAVQQRHPDRYHNLVRVARELADDSTGRKRLSKT